MIAQQLAPKLEDDSKPGLPGDLEILGRQVERHFEGSINFLASHVELGRAAFLIEKAGKDWKACESIEDVEKMAEAIIDGDRKVETNPSTAPKTEVKPTKVNKTPKVETKPAPVESSLEPEIRFTPGLVLEKDGISHVVCPGKHGMCLRLVPVTEARVAVTFNTIMRALDVKRLEDVTINGLLQKSFCPKCAETVLPLGSQTVPEAMAAIEEIFEDEREAEEASLQAEAEARVDARIAESRSMIELQRDGSMLAHGLGLVRPARREKSGKIVAGISSNEYIQLGYASDKIRKSGLTAADVRTLKCWTVAGVICMAELKLHAMLS